jgi:TetR/AcrR family transcriptional repressor of nem operon
MSGTKSDMKTEIMDAAERRIQAGGFGGFSFREIAADVGIKSSSVHYHYPAKEDLAAAVVRRWREQRLQNLDEQMAKDPDPIRVWIRIARGRAEATDKMCPCAVLGAASQDLPEKVAVEVRLFFRALQQRLEAHGLGENRAAEFLSTVVGAQILANVLGDISVYDRATEGLLEQCAGVAIAA